LDKDTTLSVLKQRVEQFRNARDWLKFHNPKDLSMALSIEASELEEIFLWKDKDDVKELEENKNQVSRIADEIADIEIYLLSLASVLSIDLSDAVVTKLALNAKRYPIEKSKGSSKKYNELQS